MTYVITNLCAESKDAACWGACPVDAIHPGPRDTIFPATEQLYINPAECIDCGACEPTCPVEAIYPADELPPELAGSLIANHKYFDDPGQTAARSA
ncbi:MAG: 4Fe-4S dicluster domain-containing protein [Pseudonocardia sp.]